MNKPTIYQPNMQTSKLANAIVLFAAGMIIGFIVLIKLMDHSVDQASAFISLQNQVTESQYSEDSLIY